MRLEKYEESKHYDLIRSWYIDRDMKPIDKKFYPEDGVICHTLGGASGAMFLLRTNTPLAILEYAILRRGIESKEIRMDCMHTMGKHLVGLAKKLGFTFIFATPESSTIISPALRLGFKQLGRTISLEV